jgi:hypothetical protein
LNEFFADTIASCPQLAARLASATLVDDVVHATGNYSYNGKICSGERFLLLGDAFAFVDPVFSSGVFLAMHSGFVGAEVVATTLDKPAEAARARKAFERDMRKGPREFSWFIFRMTNPTMRGFFMYPANPMRVKEALLGLLAGDIYGKTPLWTSLLAMKALYYAVSLGNPRRTWAAWKRRRVSVRDVGPLQGETLVKGT